MTLLLLLNPKVSGDVEPEPEPEPDVDLWLTSFGPISATATAAGSRHDRRLPSGSGQACGNC